eukprot:CAMPEP_0174341816 /NCGR_PEP_ID=MMETSP0810-20121108/25716_1 /TAXON_ID=73025 ORGANISM="Eutreptiella gymnastica-like, Strain CCMP1594" /NCGR_SAMPLE_ID=MMETSP0810 /ASSEMBLY_ACC=CAM_ASM_000659 /LENGTH=47 /DNA_ID= /DNA_START= /DNA_END= /DNA_ORIENTATION=
MSAYSSAYSSTAPTLYKEVWACWARSACPPKSILKLLEDEVVVKKKE